MTAPLEARYRRLLVAYPRRHRREYGEEMLGVLLADARPDQRRPGPRTVVDLLAGALAVRLRTVAGALRDDAWRSAAYAVQLFGAMVLLVVALRRLAITAVLLPHAPSPVPVSVTDVLRALGWALVVTATVAGWRRVAAWFAALAAAAEVARVASLYAYSPSQVLRLSWAVTTAVLVAAAGVWAARGPAPALPLRVWTFGAAGLLVAAAGVTDLVQRWGDPWGYAVTMNGVLQVRVAVGLFAVAGWLVLLVIRRLPGPVRRRLLVFLAPVAATVVLVAEGFAGFMYSSQRFPTPVYLAPVQWALLIGVPVLAFALAVAVLHRWERMIRLIALGRSAERRSGERQQASAPPLG
jgi:hypothetical protein